MFIEKLGIRFFVFVLVFAALLYLCTWIGLSESLLTFPFFALGGSGGGGGGAGGGGGSCPFLTVWDGRRYTFENDILFSKPHSLFPTFVDGMREYKKGLGGETYLLSQNPFNENGEMRFQIREIEPEQSYIDHLQVNAIDIPKGSVAVVDTDLTTYRVFDPHISKPAQSSYVYKQKTGNVYKFRPEIDTLNTSAKPEKGVLLEKNDEILLTVDISQVNMDAPVYLVVESYYRDWMLGEHIPFTYSDLLRIKGDVLYRQTLAPFVIASMLTVALTSSMNTVPKEVHSLFKTPHAHADHPDDGSDKSLIISLQEGGKSVRLATIFPRHLTPTKELVEVPVTLLQRASGGKCTLRIKATKTHKITGAFVFQGTEREAKETSLTTTKAFHRRLDHDFSDRLSEKNEHMVSLLPGDIMDVSVKSPGVEITEGHKRSYLVRTNGFYTPLEDRTFNDKWYKNLDADSKKILRGLRSVSYNSDQV